MQAVSRRQAPPKAAAASATLSAAPACPRGRRPSPSGSRLSTRSHAAPPNALPAAPASPRLWAEAACCRPVPGAAPRRCGLCAEAERHLSAAQETDITLAESSDVMHWSARLQLSRAWTTSHSPAAASVVSLRLALQLPPRSALNRQGVESRRRRRRRRRRLQRPCPRASKWRLQSSPTLTRRQQRQPTKPTLGLRARRVVTRRTSARERRGSSPFSPKRVGPSLTHGENGALVTCVGNFTFLHRYAPCHLLDSLHSLALM